MATINPILKDCIAKVAPEVRDEVRRNMESIEERATMFGISRTKHIADGKRPQVVSIMHDLYKEIAAEQKAIDIDRACEWIINTYLGDYVTDEYGNGGIGNNVKLAEDFRKAMEDEL